MVRVVVVLTPRFRELITRVRVSLDVDEPVRMPDPNERPRIWSLYPKELLSEVKHSTKVSVSSNLKILNLSRERSNEEQTTAIRVQGSGELQPRATWRLSGGPGRPLSGDHTFLAVIERPATPCVVRLGVAFEVERSGRTTVYEASLQPEETTVTLGYSDTTFTRAPSP